MCTKLWQISLFSKERWREPRRHYMPLQHPEMASCPPPSGDQAERRGAFGTVVAQTVACMGHLFPSQLRQSSSELCHFLPLQNIKHFLIKRRSTVGQLLLAVDGSTAGTAGSSCTALPSTRLPNTACSSPARLPPLISRRGECVRSCFCRTALRTSCAGD